MPTLQPSDPPTDEYCVDDESFRFDIPDFYYANRNIPRRSYDDPDYGIGNCSWIREYELYCICNRRFEGKLGREYCKLTCEPICGGVNSFQPSSLPSEIPSDAPSDSLTEDPTLYPTPTMVPSNVPSELSIVDSCSDDETFTFELADSYYSSTPSIRDCLWIQENTYQSLYCNFASAGKLVKDYCKMTCDYCD